MVRTWKEACSGILLPQHLCVRTAPSTGLVLGGCLPGWGSRQCKVLLLLSSHSWAQAAWVPWRDGASTGPPLLQLPSPRILHGLQGAWLVPRAQLVGEGLNRESRERPEKALQSQLPHPLSSAEGQRDAQLHTEPHSASPISLPPPWQSREQDPRSHTPKGS